ncbi:hypothetical protein BWI17_13995 [Betaproteobacteria bacterium GR16-43]|nr:hypothetical protein BWI17_13995 [Betaproteobacteria bacterium GR16-43]
MNRTLAPLRFAWGLAARRPFQCLVQVTNRCNMKCGFCDFWPNGVPSDQELTVDDYVRLSDALSRVGTFLVSIEGGEPLVRRDLPEIVRAFSRHHLPVLFTNGWHVDREMARTLFDAGLWQVGVSIDFADSARHDIARRLPGAGARAWQAIEHFKAAARTPGRQVHVMSIVMKDNVEALEPLLEASAARGVGHWLTLVSDKGHRRGPASTLPAPGTGERLRALWKRHPHLRTFRDYLDGIDPFLQGAPDAPRCHAGEQSFNVDHVGNVSPCIEKIDKPVGNVRRDPVPMLLDRMKGLESVARCQDCWTLCRGFGQVMGAGGTRRGWTDLASRMRGA